MTKRNEKNYDFALLNGLFFTRTDAEGDWRLYHRTDRGSRDGRGTTVRNGDLADTSTIKGYRVCSLPTQNGKTARLQAALVIWILREGRNLPAGAPIDHANRCRTDNSPQNINPSTHQANAVNRRHSDGHLIGIFENKKIPEGKRRWQALAYDPTTKKRVSLKCHHSPGDAARAYDAFVLEKRGAAAITNASLGRL
jgi:hypothetical protein